MAVRYEQKDCAFCRDDNRGKWGQLAPELQRLGCPTVIVLPSRHAAFLYGLVVPRGAPQEAFVKMDWIRHFRLSAVPTTLITGPRQHLVWYHEGELSTMDVRAALTAVRAKAAR